MEMIILSEQRQNRWQRLLRVLFGIERDPEEVIGKTCEKQWMRLPTDSTTLGLSGP